MLVQNENDAISLHFALSSTLNVFEFGVKLPLLLKRCARKTFQSISVLMGKNGAISQLIVKEDQISHNRGNC